ncbi:hypothetical protein PR048_029377 [Dryococelus australis]|uniref:Uncharacterized protein n=1 Tax=Dryococelus australis TaxID=614101 RepID=A0ABQ9GFN2_9NEOP|nr:hypothetical protein PR048_029377 [Dryococelus australis]
MCTLEPQMSVHWLLRHRVASVTPHLAVWYLLLVSLQVCYWITVFQGVSNRLRSNCKVNSTSVRGLRACPDSPGECSLAHSLLMSQRVLSAVTTRRRERERESGRRRTLGAHSRTLSGSHFHQLFGAATAERLACSPPTKVGSIPGQISRGFSHTAGRQVFSGISRLPRPFIPVLLYTHLNRLRRLSRPRFKSLGQYQLGSPLVDDRPVTTAVKYKVVSGVVWTNRTMTFDQSNNKVAAESAVGRHSTARTLHAISEPLRVGAMAHLQLIPARQRRVVNCCKVSWRLPSAVHSRCTQQEPVSTVQFREIDCIPATRKRASRWPLHGSCGTRKQATGYGTELTPAYLATVHHTPLAGRILTLLRRHSLPPPQDCLLLTRTSETRTPGENLFSWRLVDALTRNTVESLQPRPYIPVGWACSLVESSLSLSLQTLHIHNGRLHFAREYLPLSAATQSSESSRSCCSRTVQLKVLLFVPFVFFYITIKRMGPRWCSGETTRLLSRQIGSDSRYVGIVPTHAAGLRVFSGISRFSRSCIPVLLHTHLASSSWALKVLLLRATQISPLTHSFTIKRMGPRLNYSPPSRQIGFDSQYVGIVPDHAAGLRVFPGISHSPAFAFSPHFIRIVFQEFYVKRQSKSLHSNSLWCISTDVSLTAIRFLFL